MKYYKLRPMDALLYLCIVLFVIRIIIFIILHLKYPSLSIMRNTVSDYGVGRSRSLYTIMSVLSATAYALITAIMWRKANQSGWLISTLGTAALGSFAIILFPTDLTGQSTRTRTGIVHWLFAVANFSLLFIFIANAHIAAGSLRHALAITAILMRVVFYVFVVSLLFSNIRRRYIGLTERLFLLGVPIWFMLFSWNML